MVAGGSAVLIIDWCSVFSLFGKVSWSTRLPRVETCHRCLEGESRLQVNPTISASWRQNNLLASASMTRFHAALPVSGNQILVCGGCSAIGALLDVHIFNIGESVTQTAPIACGDHKNLFFLPPSLSLFRHQHMELGVLSCTLLQASCGTQRGAFKQLRTKIHRQVWAKRKCQRVLHATGVWRLWLLWHLLQRRSQMHRGDPWRPVKASLGKESNLARLLSSFSLKGCNCICLYAV